MQRVPQQRLEPFGKDLDPPRQMLAVRIKQGRGQRLGPVIAQDLDKLPRLKMRAHVIGR